MLSLVHIIILSCFPIYLLSFAPINILYFFTYCISLSWPVKRVQAIMKSHSLGRPKIEGCDDAMGTPTGKHGVLIYNLKL